MQLKRLVISGFQSFGPDPTTIELEPRTFLLGPNGSGKTAVLHALTRLFGHPAELRRIRDSDFHRPLPPALKAGLATAIPAESVNHQADTGELTPQPALMIEAHFTYDELADGDGLYPSVAPAFRHMSLLVDGGVAELRVRLTATLDADGEVDEHIDYITGYDDAGQATAFAQMARSDRALFQVHYLPARRDPADHIRSSANSLIGRVLRSASWAPQADQITQLSEQLTGVLAANAAVGGLDESLTQQWTAVHTGTYFANPEVSFDAADLDGLLRHLTVSFRPGPTSPATNFDRLSDGQQSLLYISLVLAVQALGRKAIAGQVADIDVLKLRPPVFMLMAVEEPENSLSPHHLGRVLAQLTKFAEQEDAQVVLATHSAPLLRRVDPGEIRHLRLDDTRCTRVATIDLPVGELEAAKFVREAVQAYPELYFARLVVLGEGDSEEIVLPRLLGAHALVPDHVSVSVVPLGGRHVNHFWRLLTSLGIPHVTILDLDAGRHQGSWGRLNYAITQHQLHAGTGDFANVLEVLPAWDHPQRPDQTAQGQEVIADLEEAGVFFSGPLDLDYAMLAAYPDAYGLDPPERADPDERTITSVLGRAPGPVDDLYTPDEQRLFEAYRTRFKAASKPAQHLGALSRLTDEQLIADLPAVYGRLIDAIATRLQSLPE